MPPDDTTPQPLPRPPAQAPKRPRRDFSRDECLRAWHAYHLGVTGGRAPTSDWLALVSRIPRPAAHRLCVKLGLPLSRKRRGRERGRRAADRLPSMPSCLAPFSVSPAPLSE